MRAAAGRIFSRHLDYHRSVLPAEPNLEIRRRLPASRTRKPPLVFVHGGYCDAWCWEPYFLPWFASRGYPSYALSLRGHGRSGGAESLVVAGLEDYEADVEHVAGLLDAAPVFVGHSMGAAIVERIVAKRPVRGAALLAPVPPAGLLTMAARLAAGNPDYLLQMNALDPTRMSATVLAALQPYYFSEDVAPEILAEAPAHLNAESPVRCSTCHCGCTGRCRARTAGRFSSWAPKGTASRCRTTCAPRPGTMAWPRRSCRGSRTC
jgi:pimeloyl-ACP methyl ester carboxylesterase